MYLQDRIPGRTPRWRGVTLVHELRAAGVPVSVASDNTRDPFYAYGDMDMVEVVPRGDAHPAARPPGRRLAARRERDARRGDGPGRYRLAEARRRRPTCCCSAPAG